MRGASAESLTALTEKLGQAVDGGADAGRLADDLFAISAVLADQPSLRRVLTDLSLVPAAKADLVRTVFEGKVDTPGLELVGEAARLRWTTTRDLVDVLEQLGVVALVRAADAAGQGDALESDLFAAGRLVADNPELRDALSDPARTVADKRGLVRSLLEGKVTSAAVRLAEQAVAGTHRTVSVAIEEYQKLAANHRDRLVGTVRVARSLSDADRARLENALSRQYSRPVHLNVLVDPTVLGGVKVEIAADVIDGTVSSRLDDARRRLAG